MMKIIASWHDVSLPLFASAKHFLPCCNRVVGVQIQVGDFWLN
jgi:hypothetical protein